MKTPRQNAVASFRLVALLGIGLLTLSTARAQTPPPGETPREATPREATPREATPREAKPGEAKPGEAKPGEAKPREAKPSEAKPGEAKPREAKPEPRRVEPAARGTAPTTVKKKAVVKKKKPPEKGWFPKLSLGASLAMVHNWNIPGIEDGINLTIGLVLNGELEYRHYQHNWKTTLKIVHTQSKTPSVKPFLKTADELNLKSGYTYRFKKLKKLGVLGALQLIAPLFPGDLVVAGDTDLVLNRVDGTVDTDLAVQNEKYRLTGAFSPLIFKQLAGATIRPLEDKLATMDLGLSLAGLEVWASGYTVQNDAATLELDLKELQNYQQVGLQLDIDITGKIAKRLTYTFSAELMYPLYTSIDTGLDGFNLLNVDLAFKLGLKLASWASLDYVFGAKKIPLIVNQWQIVNNLVISLTANLL